MRDGFQLKQAATLAEVAKALNEGHAKGAAWPALVFVTDDARVPDPVGALEALPQGCAILFRHYGAADREASAAHVTMRAREQNRLVIVAGDLALAHQLTADGFHLPQHLLESPRDWRGEWPGRLTAAVHSQEAVDLAAQRGCDAAFLSPVFPTPSHPGAEHLGVAGFSAITRTTTLPLYALGGVTAETALQLKDSGAVGLAAIGGLLP